ncbi:hypothetical protein BC343_13210 [Mucilaginibacter pedocola]|uniref:DUF998 domain-containing protein n=1 Tax=Mucilaginibacter pedocola TaxID=1792845 RepID=A0A1S9PAD9_9SPHI|nr:hypothetical protein BC343_13210 [Mucilaginibacter pedocola]
MRKHAVLLGVIISFIFMIKAIMLYPGGSYANAHSVGFTWGESFICNLFGEHALNGALNPARYWAYTAMILFPCTYALFFVRMAKKMPEKNAAVIIQIGGVANILATFLIATGLHDLMLIISTSLFWTCLVIITIFILKTKLHWLKFLCVISLLMFYYSVYLWGISDWNLLPITQKINFATSTLLILLLEYCTSKEDFAHIKPKRNKKLATEL